MLKSHRIRVLGVTLTLCGLVSALFVALTNLWLENTGKQVTAAGKSRYTSYLLADELRQSSDDLTPMSSPGMRPTRRSTWTFWPSVTVIKNGLRTIIRFIGISSPQIARCPAAVV